MFPIFSLLLLSYLGTLAHAAPSRSNDCSFTEGNYHLEWSVDDNDNVNFQLEFDNFPSTDVWTGVAFGETMDSGLDAIIVKSLKGQLSITDEHVKGYGPSNLDAQQNVRTEQLSVNDGKLRAQFSRPAKASEPGADHNLGGCTSWQFVTGLGEVHSDHVGKHSRTPTHRRVCLEECKK